MKQLLLVLPDQLFKHHNGLQSSPDRILLIEEPLYFGISAGDAGTIVVSADGVDTADGEVQSAVDRKNSGKHSATTLLKHRQKLVFHRASMQAYCKYLQAQGYQVDYYNVQPNLIDSIFAELSLRKKPVELMIMDPVNSLLRDRLKSSAESHKLSLQIIDAQHFINTPTDNNDYRSARKRWFMADFYQYQRKRLDILMENDKPVGGKWSFDADNRKKIPKAERSLIPSLEFAPQSECIQQARDYVDSNCPNAIGNAQQCPYPIDYVSAEVWLEQFLQQRFAKFGPYEDALVSGQSWLYHSVLTPMLNTGLLTPQQVVDAALEYWRANPDAVPLAGVEGFIRQVIGWREFIRATYDDLGDQMRDGNHWQHHQRLPQGFYTATTGITPIDDVIRRVLDTGYAHHIERLMVLGGFMFLCEIAPRDIYRWFMTMFIDAYDWVMVPNVYAMSQHADGGLITTKPYFSGSAYLKKMGYDASKDDQWCAIWDALYWRWISKQKAALRKNPRWAMMCSMADKMEPVKMQGHLDTAEAFLAEFIVD